MSDTTSRVYALLMADNKSSGGEFWQSCSLANVADFEASARRILGDRTEVTGAELDGCDWPDLFSDFLALSRPQWMVDFVATLGPRSRETWDAMQEEKRA